MYFTISKKTYYAIRRSAVIASWLIWGIGLYLTFRGYINHLAILFLLGGVVPYILANVLTTYSENENT